MWYDKRERVSPKRICTNLFVRLAFVVGRRMWNGFTIDVAMIKYIEILQDVDDFCDIFGNQSLVIA